VTVVWAFTDGGNEADILNTMYGLCREAKRHLDVDYGFSVGETVR
jgi:hypothetical protein